MDKMLRKCRLNLLKNSYLSYARCVHHKQIHRGCFSELWARGSEYKTKVIEKLDKTALLLSNISQRSIVSFNHSRLQNERQMHKSNVALRKEINALSSMLYKSGMPPQSILKQVLKSDSSRWFSSSSSKHQQQQQSQEDPNKQDKDDDDKDKDGKTSPWVWIQPFVATVVMYQLFKILTYDESVDTPSEQVSWNEFVHDMLAKGEVEEVTVRPDLELAFLKLYPGAIIRGKPNKDTRSYHMRIPDIDKFEARLRKAENDLGIKPGQGVPVAFVHDKTSHMIVDWLVFLIIMGALMAFLKNSVNIQVQDMFSTIRKAKFVRVDQISNQPGRAVTFRDVAGLHEAKVEVMEFVDYLKNPDRYKQLGARIPHGALLLGPPGCGKTLLAKAVATEAKVPFLAMAGSEFVEIVGGLGAARVRDLFKEAREKTPCIIYIDEIDAIGRKRGGNVVADGTSEGEQTLNQLLVELDGMDTVEGIIMLASTNRHDVLDKALLRPGRFDRHIKIDLPTLAERKEIFEIYLSKLKLVRAVQAYSERLAQLSPGMSGADIANICNEAALAAARDKKKAIDTGDFEYAVERVIAGVAKKSRVLSPQEKRCVAYHEAGHAVVAWLLKHTDSLLKVTIVPRTSAVLGFAQYTIKDTYLISKEELFEQMCVALGGRVAESITFNSVTSGAQNDMQKVRQFAYQQIRKLGMNDIIGPVSFDVNEENEFAVKPYSKKTARIIDEEAQRLVTQAYKATESLLIENKEKLRAVAEALLEKETLSYTDMEELIGPPPYGKENTLSAKWGDMPPPTPPSPPPVNPPSP